MKKYLPALSVLAAFGCADVTEEPASRAPQRASISSLTEYVHPFSRSRFAIGPSTAQKVEFGLDKVVGDWGVFATNQKTSMVLALPNGDAPSRLRPALSGDAKTHNLAVKNYFSSAGLPVDELDSVSAHTKMSASGAGVEPPAAWKFESYASTISRQYDGIPVVDSFAWAQFNDLGEVVTESVYWPEISQAVLAAATLFKKHLDDPAAKGVFFSTVPEGGRLVIHHTPGTWEHAFQASVSYDVLSPSGKTTHHDANGDNFVLPEEAE